MTDASVTYLLLKSPLQGLHFHLLFPESGVESGTLGLRLGADLSNFLVGSVKVFWVRFGEEIKGHRLATKRQEDGAPAADFPKTQTWGWSDGSVGESALRLLFQRS